MNSSTACTANVKKTEVLDPVIQNKSRLNKCFGLVYYLKKSGRHVNEIMLRL